MKSGLLALGVAVCVLALSASAVGAQRTFVASYGVDANPCSILLPCRGFAAAVAQTSPGGEVVVLDSAGYGSVTITQSVSIIAPSGVYAGVSVMSGNGVTVAAGPYDKVVLRGLTINGQGGDSGVVVTSAWEVHIEDCTIANMAQDGIGVNVAKTYIRNTKMRSNHIGLHLGTTGVAPDSVHVTDSDFSANGWGIVVPGGTLVASRITAEKNGNHGILAAVTPPFSFATVILSDSVLSGNFAGGVYASTPGPGTSIRLEFLHSTSARNVNPGLAVECGGGAAFLVVSDSSVVENGSTGVFANHPCAIAIISASTIAGNTDADLAQADSAVLRTSGTNTLTGRGAADISGTLTTNPMK